MKIRYKIWLFIILIISVTIIVINVIGNNILVTSYESLENKKMNTDIQRFHNALSNEINQLGTATRDWANWDETYLFLVEENDEFIDKNMDNETLTYLRTDVMIYVNSFGNIIYKKGFNYSKQTIMNVSSTLNSYIYKNSSLINFVDINDKFTGIIQLPEGPMLIASLPVLTSNREGPSHGAIIWGRYLNSNELLLLSDITNLTISINTFNDQTSPSDFQDAALALMKNNDIFIKPLDGDYIAGYSTITDIFGQPALIVKVVMDRDIYNQGITTIQYFQILIVILGIILCIAMISFFNLILLSRLNNLRKQVLSISKKNDFSTKIKISGNDELNELANVANNTIKIITDMNTNLEQKVLDRTEKINHLLKQKDEFINQLGHDLKNPLNPLVNLLPILEKSESDTKTKEMFNILIKNANYMKNLVTKTIDLGKLNSSKIKFYFEDVNLYTEFNNVISNNEILFKEKNIVIKNNIPDNIIVQADKLRINELINNLLNNAAKYTKCLGNITLDAKQDNNYITVSVKDSGIGMTNDQLEHVFDEFYKADPARHDFDSSGLGLSICKRIVEIHDGKIWVESKGLGEGSIFYFTIPKNKIINVNISMENIYNKIDKIGK